MPSNYPAIIEWNDEGDNDIRVLVRSAEGLAITLQRLADDVRRHQHPICADLTDENGDILFLGIWRDGAQGFAAYQPHDTDTGKHWGMLPALWSLGEIDTGRVLAFHLCVNDCPFDVSSARCIPLPLVREIAGEWLETGSLSQKIA